MKVKIIGSWPYLSTNSLAVIEITFKSIVIFRYCFEILNSLLTVKPTVKSHLVQLMLNFVYIYCK